MVQPETMLPAIKAWNEHAGRIGCAQLRVIVLNACRSDEHAQKLAGCVDFAIGHAELVYDRKAIVFSETLYSCVCEGMSLAESFDTARSAASSPGYRIYANADPRAFCPGDCTSGVTPERATERDHTVEGVLHTVAESVNHLNAAVTELRNPQRRSGEVAGDAMLREQMMAQYAPAARPAHTAPAVMALYAPVPQHIELLGEECWAMAHEGPGWSVHSPSASALRGSRPGASSVSYGHRDRDTTGHTRQQSPLSKDDIEVIKADGNGSRKSFDRPGRRPAAAKWKGDCEG
jgi:hypothetical protein